MHEHAPINAAEHPADLEIRNLSLLASQNENKALRDVNYIPYCTFRVERQNVKCECVTSIIERKAILLKMAM